MLDEIFDLQRQLQVMRFRDPARMNRTEAIEFIRWNVLALENELHEALQEIGWKPWATSTHINREEYIGELVDGLHFLVNLFLVVGATADEVFRHYSVKNARNHTRQIEGYDGVSSKCMTCHRDIKYEESHACQVPRNECLSTSSNATCSNFTNVDTV